MTSPFRFDLSEVIPMMRVTSRHLYSQSGNDFYRRAMIRIDPLPEQLSGAEAAAYLSRQAHQLNAELSSQVQAFPSHWWLLLLRFISPVVFACNSGNYSRYRGYAERVSAASTRTLIGTSAIGILGEPQIKRTLRLVATAAACEDVHTAAGMVNCGASLAPGRNGSYELVMSDELRESVTRFDTQLRLLNQDAFTRMGAAYLGPLEQGHFELKQTLLTITALELPITPESFREDEVADLLQFAPQIIVLDRSLTEIPWAGLPRELGVKLRILTAVMRSAFADIGTRPTLWQRLHQTGLINRPQREFDDYLAQLCADANDWGSAMFPGTATVTRDDALSVITDSTGGRSGRYYGPAVRLGHDFFCIDLLAAWLRVESVVAASTSGGGPVPNMRARIWEVIVQRAIDQTAWKPSPVLAAAVSRQLKRDGRVFSDLDAAGARDGVLLIVSCKSWQMNEKYDNLDYSARRNRAGEVIKAAKKLASDINNLAGDAHRFVAPQQLEEIQGVVCVSMPLLLTPQETLELHEAAPGIEILTLPELTSKLRGAELPHYNPESWQQYLTLSYSHSPHRGL